MATEPLTKAIDAGTPLVVLSPHLDDAVLSCGGLLAHAARRTRVCVVTFFTEAGEAPYTLSGRRYLRQTGHVDAEHLYQDRRAEDREVLEQLGVDWLHLGLSDGLFRRKPGARGASAGWVHRVLPERSHVYPTYRLHLSTGRISRHDAGTLKLVRDLLGELMSQRRSVLLAPSGVGHHVDHVLVRTAAELSGEPVIYYSDFPYNLRHPLDPGFLERNALVPVEWTREVAVKAAMIRGYRSQADSLFPGGEIPVVPETYLLADGDRTSRNRIGGA